MIKKIIKYFSVITAPIFILVLLECMTVGSMPDKIYVNKSIDVASSNLITTSRFNKVKLVKDKISVNLLGVLPVKQVAVQQVEGLEVYPGGTSIGVKISNKGAMVVGYSDVETSDGMMESPGKLAGIQLGDIIEEVNGKKVNSCSDLISTIKSCRNADIQLKLLRDNDEIIKKMQILKEGNEYKIGLWVRDSTAGIGTLTFYDKDSKVFGALGHPITDGDTNTSFNINSGKLLRSSVLSIKKGERGNPGELKGLFVNENDTIGTIEKNLDSGIYGEAKASLINDNFSKPMPVGFRNEIKEGHAQIITTINDEGPKAYDIEIIKLLQQDKPGSKSMVIKITDQQLLEKTGGIVQGMSGSPIIQNGKIVGAVTHVLINKPDVGYGIYIEWMLQDAGIIK